MKIIKDCFIGPEIYGVYSVTIPLQRYIVYSQDIRELIGIDQPQTILRSKSAVFIELGHFFRALRDNDIEAWKVFTCNPDFIEVDNMSYAIDGYEGLVTSGLIEDFTREGKENIKKVSEKLVDYAEFAYLCGEQLMIAESLILSKQFKPSKPEVLQSIIDYRLHEDTLKSELQVVVDNIEKHLPECTFESSIDKTFLNELLLKLRGYDILHR